MSFKLILAKIFPKLAFSQQFSAALKKDVKTGEPLLPPVVTKGHALMRQHDELVPP
jgi:hypothetical protein